MFVWQFSQETGSVHLLVPQVFKNVIWGFRGAMQKMTRSPI